MVSAIVKWQNMNHPWTIIRRDCRRETEIFITLISFIREHPQLNGPFLLFRLVPDRVGESLGQVREAVRNVVLHRDVDKDHGQEKSLANLVPQPDVPESGPYSLHRQNVVSDEFAGILVGGDTENCEVGQNHLHEIISVPNQNVMNRDS